MTASKHSWYTLKYLLAAIIVILIGYQIHSAQKQDDIVQGLQQRDWVTNIVYLIVAISLMPINWYLESVKWRILMKPFLNISQIEAIKSVLVGIALGIVTPARIGEYGGRILMTPFAKSKEVVSSTFAGSLAQNLSNIIIGLLLSYFILKDIFDKIFHHPYLFLTVVGLQITLMLGIYFYLSKIMLYASRLSVPIKLKKLFYKAGHIYPKSFNLLNKVFLISFLRYSVYFVQYILILLYLGIKVKEWLIASHVAGIYLIQTLMPLPAFLSVPARGEIAILVWQNVGITPLWALAATYCLWLINLIVPSVIGIIILLKSRKNNPDDEVSI